MELVVTNVGGKLLKFEQEKNWGSDRADGKEFKTGASRRISQFLRGQ